MGIPILLGRDFASGDNEGGAKVAIVNESAARLFFPGEKPVGRRIGLGPGAQLDTQIVGIVGDAKYDRLRELVPQLVYTPALQASGGALEVTFEVKTQAEYPNLVNAVQREVQKVNNLPIYNVRTLSSVSGTASTSCVGMGVCSKVAA